MNLRLIIALLGVGLFIGWISGPLYTSEAQTPKPQYRVAGLVGQGEVLAIDAAERTVIYAGPRGSFRATGCTITPVGPGCTFSGNATYLGRACKLYGEVKQTAPRRTEAGYRIWPSVVLQVQSGLEMVLQLPVGAELRQ